MTHGLADVVANVSREAVSSFERLGAVPRGGMVAVHNGIDTDRFRFNMIARSLVRREFGLAEDELLILAVGRLDLQKDYPNLLDALCCLHVTARWRLAIVGDGPLKTDLVKLVYENDLESRVIFLGIRFDIPELMSAADVFVLSSSWEGFGLVVAEAMACERIVVATDCGGVAEVLGDCGVLVPARSSHELATALGQALSYSDAVRHELGLKARKRVADLYSLDRAVDTWLMIYDDVTNVRNRDMT
jgi:glycosyltransferase involved in cell wall biosynthesis